MVAAAGRLDFQPPVEGGLIPVTRDLDALILDILCLKDAIDAYLLSPDKAVDLLAAGLSALGLRELSDDQKKKLLRKLNDRVDWEGLSRPELEIITGISQRTLSRALERLERMGLVEPKKKERVGRRESKRGGVLIFKVVRPQVERFMKRHVSVVRLIFEGEG
ncbi:MAG: hypothetical protein QI223_06955 [Candidatus Korarchaeota archaeon]|nr:hypothetical protein [Candidatus Korarchaeota archaeon]